MLAVIGWPLLLAFVGVAVASALQAVRFAREDDETNKIHVSWSWAACSGSVCMAIFSAALAGVISATAGVILGAVTALITLAVLWEDARQPEGDEGTRGFAKAAGDMVVAAAWAVRSVFHRDSEADADALPDGVPLLADRRDRRAVLETEPVAAVAGDVRPEPVRAPKPRPLPQPEERTPPPVSTPPSPAAPPSGAGAAADVLTGVHVLCTHALSGGVQSVERVTATLTQVTDGIGRALHTLGTRLSEPDQHYGPEVWEKFLAMAAHLQGAAMTGAETSSVLHMVGSKPLREFGTSGITAPHHEKVNSV